MSYIHLLDQLNMSFVQHSVNGVLKRVFQWKTTEPLSIAKSRKIQQTMFVWACESQTPKPEHGCKIKLG